MKYFLIFLAGLNICYALESSDQLKTQILNIYDKNVLVINRGLEDAISKADHGKFTSDDGFIARGICIKAGLLLSHWKIYRVVRPELVSKDTEYTLRSINQSEIPPSLLKYSKVDFSDYYNDFNDEKRNKQLELQQERIAKYDLPSFMKEAQVNQKKSKTKFDKFIDKNFDNEKFKTDINKTYFEIFASPLTFQTRYDQKETHYGANLYNLGKKYRYKISSIETQRKVLNPVTKDGYTAKSSHHELNFQVNRITEMFSVLSFAIYDKEKIGDIYYPYDHYIVGFFGLRLHLLENDPQTSLFDISYTPSFDNIKFTDPNNPSKLLEREGIRHYFKIRMYGKLTENLFNKTEILYSPLIELASSHFDYEDTYINISSLFSYRVSEQFFFDYKINFEQDELRAKVYDISENNTTQSLRFRYQVAL